MMVYGPCTTKETVLVFTHFTLDTHTHTHTHTHKHVFLNEMSKTH